MKATTPRTLTVSLTLKEFKLPPVQNALIIGKKAPIGAIALDQCLEDLMPGRFERVDVEHELIEAVLVRKADLRRLGTDQLIPLLVRHAEGIMEDGDAIQVALQLEVRAEESLEA